MQMIDEATQEAVDDTCRFIIRFGMTTPAILAIESMRPLSFVGSQLMHMLSPSIAVFLTPNRWDSLARLLERREGLEFFLKRLETLDAERSDRPSGGMATK